MSIIKQKLKQAVNSNARGENRKLDDLIDKKSIESDPIGWILFVSVSQTKFNNSIFLSFLSFLFIPVGCILKTVNQIINKSPDFRR